MAIQNKLTIEGSGKGSPRFGSHEYFGANLYSVPNGAALLFVFRLRAIKRIGIRPPVGLLALRSSRAQQEDRE